MIFYNGAWIKNDLGFYWWNEKRFYTLEQAKLAYNEAAKKYHGEFARVA